MTEICEAIVRYDGDTRLRGVFEQSVKQLRDRLLSTGKDK
jgi:hypothetical protein